MMRGARTIRIHGQDVPVRAKLEDLCGFSGHADSQETMRWLGRMEKPPRKIFLVHGEEDSAVALAAKLKDKGYPAHVPRLNEVVALEN